MGGSRLQQITRNQGKTGAKYVIEKIYDGKRREIHHMSRVRNDWWTATVLHWYFMVSGENEEGL